MELKKCKLGELIELQRGYDLPVSQMQNGIVPVAGSNGIIGWHNVSKIKPPCITIGRSGSVGKIHYYDTAIWPHNTSLFVKDFKGNDEKYIYYLLKTIDLSRLCDSSVVPSLNRNFIYPLEVEVYTDILQQKRIAHVLSTLDRKISLNRSINAELERMAKEIYDYWFVQFEFPDANGRPYKSSGGAMVYNPVLKREVPEGWEVKSFADFVSKQNGDWGEENPTITNDIEVLCARGADIVQMEDLPHRYISKSHLDRLMKKGDIMVEISGGSPVQATGRCSYISEALLSRLGKKLVCSNFCQVVRVQDYEMSSYLYMTWDLLYKNDNMFKFEGKTSGIKNFQIDSFLQTKWSIPPHNLISKYQVFFDNLLSKKEALKKEITLLQNQRDELLPLLMTGQVKIK